MYRLASLEEANVALGRDQLKQHAIEQVRRCVQCLKDALVSADLDLFHSESRLFSFLDISF